MKDSIFPQSDTGLPWTESFPVHLVHFYDDGAFPDRSIADFLWTGLQADESAVIIATSEHMGALRECLTTRGAALHALERSGRLTALDAHATLEQLRGESLPDRARLLSVLSPTLDQASAVAPNGRWRMFGEMTMLLAEEGNIEGSIELEWLWNELFSTRSFRLYCAYPIRQFAHESLAEPFSQMCSEHDEVVPVLTWLDKPERHGRWLAVLQQRARALQVEINERKQTEEALQQTQQDYAALVDSIDGIVWEVNVQTFMFTFVSKKAERLLGYPTARWLTEPTFWRDHIHGEDQEWAMNFCVNATQEKRDHSFEYRMIAADGRTVWLQDIVNVIVENNEPVKLRGVMVDITERKRAEEALRKSEARYRLLAENATDIIWTADLNFRLTYISPSIDYILGYSVEEAMAQTMASFLTPPSVQVAQQALQEELALEKTDQGGLPRTRTLELESMRKNGSRVWTEVKMTSIHSPEGQPIGVLGVTRDISERKRLEEQLRQSHKMEAIGLLAGGIAHDFNNLLTAILGYSSLLLTNLDEDSPLRPDIVGIKKAGERAASLTRQLLAFSRQQVLQLELLNLNTVVANMGQMLYRLIGEDIELVTILKTGLKWVKADLGQIEQVIINLVVNARDAMREGGKLTLETTDIVLDKTYARYHVGVKPGPYVLLAISDTGQGMDAETQTRIFDPFFTTKEQGKGTGLGLAIVHGIVNQIGGHIWVYSELGQGTTFKIYLPQVEVASELATPGQASAKPWPGWETILLVEDGNLVREMVQQALQRDGYTVMAANNGVQACQAAAAYQGPIHLLLTDVVMPGGMSGPQLAANLTGLRPEMKVLYMSGYTDSAIIHHGVLEPSITFLEKPFSPDALIRKIRAVLDTECA